MGKINKSVQGIEDKIRPLTLVISSELWDKFKILSTAKDLTLNDYVVALIASEVASKKEAIQAIQVA